MKILYLDTSALLRMCLADSPDAEAAFALLDLDPGQVRLVSSELLWLEADRAAIRLAHEQPDLANIAQPVQAALACVDCLPLSSAIITAARQIPQVIKSLDAIHIAAAESLGDALTTVITYDKAMTSVLAERAQPVSTASAFLAAA